MAINGLHAILFSKKADETRAFFRDVLGFQATVDDLTRKGLTIPPVQDQPWGRLTHIPLPSGESLGIYEPKHPVAHSVAQSSGKR